jgi:outer membrane protein assembly factor BamB
MATGSNVIVAGIKGTVLAIDRNTGKTLWSTDLKGSEFVNVT